MIGDIEVLNKMISFTTMGGHMGGDVEWSVADYLQNTCQYHLQDLIDELEDCEEYVGDLESLESYIQSAISESRALRIRDREECKLAVNKAEAVHDYLVDVKRYDFEATE